MVISQSVHGALRVLRACCSRWPCGRLGSASHDHSETCAAARSIGIAVLLCAIETVLAQPLTGVALDENAV